MNYVLALLLPPVSVLLIGRIFTALVLFMLWVPALVLTLGGAHPFFILIAWILIYEKKADRRARREG